MIFFTRLLCLFPFLFLIGLGAIKGNEPKNNSSLDVEMPTFTSGADTFNVSIAVLRDGKRDSSINGEYQLSITANNLPNQTKRVDFDDGQGKLLLPIDQTATFFFQIKSESLSTTKTIIYRPPWTSIIPPLIAILLALVFREVISALFLGIFSGLLLIKGFTVSGFFTALFRFADHYLIGVLSQQSHISIIVFSLLIGGMVSLISSNGGMAGLVNHLKKWARSARRSQLVTWLTGLLIFFDDYANTLIVGNTMRPLTDRFLISREKLAYLVDSTAAPIASVAFITTWIGAQLDYIEGATAGLPIEQNAYAIFFNSLSYAFYPLFSLVFILMLILSNRDFGPMLKAERAARNNSNKPKQPDQEEAGESEPQNGAALDALLPLIVLVFTAFGSLIYTGYDAATWISNDKGFFVKLAETIGQADAYAALLWASLTSLIIAFLLTIIRRTHTLQKAMDKLIDGFKSMLGALMILILAWTLAMVSDTLDTAGFLADLFTGNIAPSLLPAIVFILAAVVSFSTGSSWGTMAILYPLVLPMTYQAGIGSGISHETVMPIFNHVVSVVLAGSVLGDHCSPLSDTTILSSLSTKCEHIQHVRTQLPYALLVGGVSLIIGHLLTAFNWLPNLLAFPLGIVCLWLTLRYVVGKKVDSV